MYKSTNSSPKTEPVLQAKPVLPHIYVCGKTLHKQTKDSLQNKFKGIIGFIKPLVRWAAFRLASREELGGAVQNGRLF